MKLASLEGLGPFMGGQSEATGRWPRHPACSTNSRVARFRSQTRLPSASLTHFNAILRTGFQSTTVCCASLLRRTKSRRVEEPGARCWRQAEL
jgi:hypothetical protein